MSLMPSGASSAVARAIERWAAEGRLEGVSGRQGVLRLEVGE